jgi:uncharacterized protein VirK/YbjX
MLPIAIEMDSKLDEFGIMKTTVEIPKDAFRDLMKFTKAKTKKAAIVQAIEEFNQRQRMARLTRHFGTLENFMTQDDLRKMRESGLHQW